MITKKLVAVSLLAITLHLKADESDLQKQLAIVQEK
jgi:hypothetical protein